MLAENTIGLGLSIVARMQRFPYENDIPGGQINFSKHRGSQKIQLKWDPVFVARTEFHVKMIFHGEGQINMNKNLDSQNIQLD